jgi:UDP:flavonoid glycosyltransferase YjiC (YdhE family)
MRRELPAHHHFIGPVLWSPKLPLPPWWNDLPTDRPLVYANLGSSGGTAALVQVISALAGRDCTLLAATAGASAPDGATAMARKWPGLRLAPYLPGDLASARADVVVCNGGSMTCQQALLLGRPVLGIPGNMDQFMNMSAVVAAGAGISLRADRLGLRVLQQALDELLGNPVRRQAAQALGQRLQGLPAPQRLHALLPLLAAGAPDAA